MTLSEHIEHCQQMLKTFGDADIYIPTTEPSPLKTGVAIVHHSSSDTRGYYTIRKSLT